MATIKKDDFLIFNLPAVVGQKEARALFSQLEDELNAGNRHFVADAAKTTFIDSSGIGVLVRMLKAIKEKGGDFHLQNLSGVPSETFVESGLNHLFTIRNEDEIARARDDLFAKPVEMTVECSYESIDDKGIVHFSGIMNTREAIIIFKREVLLALADKKKILLDFENLTFLDSMAVGELIGIQKLLSSTNGELRISGSNELLRDLFETLNIDKIITCYEDTKSAIAGW